jgi:hypothetical protein
MTSPTRVPASEIVRILSGAGQHEPERKIYIPHVSDFLRAIRNMIPSYPKVQFPDDPRALVVPGYKLLAFRLPKYYSLDTRQCIRVRNTQPIYSVDHAVTYNSW